MRVFKYSLVVLAVVLLLGTQVARADQIFWGGSSGSVYFCSTGTSIAVSSSAAGCDSGAYGATLGGATANLESPVGTIALSGEPWTITFPETFRISDYDANVFSSIVGNPLTFTFGSGANTLAGNMTVTLIKDGTVVPQFMGDMLVTSGGTGLLANLYPQGATVPFDFTLKITGNSLLPDVLAGNSCYTTASMSSGQLPAVPEPATALLMGLGLLGLHRVIRRKRA